MSGFNLPPGVSVNDIPGNEHTPPITPGRDNISMEMHQARCAIRNGMGIPEHMVSTPPHCEDCAPEFPCWNGSGTCRKALKQPPVNNAATQALEIARRIRAFMTATRGGYVAEYPTLEALLIVALTPLHVERDNYKRSIERAHAVMDESGLIMDHEKSKQGLTPRVKSICAYAKRLQSDNKELGRVAAERLEWGTMMRREVEQLRGELTATNAVLEELKQVNASAIWEGINKDHVEQLAQLRAELAALKTKD